MKKKSYFQQGNRLRSQKGASLIEALISLLIFSIGLLGIAGLVVSSLAQQKIAQSRSEGAVYAAEIAEQMRANVAGLNANGYISTIDGTLTGTPITTYNQAKTRSDGITARDMTCDATATNPCSATQMAQSSMNNWLFSIQQTLPSGTALIQAGLEPTARTITVMWDAKASSQIDNSFTLVDTVNCPAALGTPSATFRCVTLPFLP